MSCAGDNGECPEPVEAATLCKGHRKRKSRGKPIDTPLNDYDAGWGTVAEAIERYASTNGFDAEEFRRAKMNVQTAFKRWMAERWLLIPKKKQPRNTVPKPTDS